MNNKYNENNAIATAAPLFCPRRTQSPTPQNTRFCVNPTRFSLFFERRRGWEEEFFVNEGGHAGGREEARGLAAGVSFGL